MGRGLALYAEDFRLKLSVTWHSELLNGGVCFEKDLFSFGTSSFLVPLSVVTVLGLIGGKVQKGGDQTDSAISQCW